MNTIYFIIGDERELKKLGIIEERGVSWEFEKQQK